eukprot:Pompholyxophrys_punicea_v1_NODE_933_length_1122_cov_2.798500.p1 type:complete len:277 gc:universal NODE_933_length_1122_cov_2.798500:196-1026(+)
MKQARLSFQPRTSQNVQEIIQEDESDSETGGDEFVFWKKDYLKENDWIEERNNPGGYYCKLCIAAHSQSRTGQWTRKPCTNSDPAKAIRKHKASKEHKNSIDAIQVKKSIPKLRMEMNSQVVEVLIKRFREIYWLCKEKMPLMKYNSLLELETINGAFSGLESILSGGRSSYTSHDFLNEAVEVLADVVSSKIIKLISESPVLGLIVDESLDISTTSQMVVYYRLESHGKKYVAFGGIENLRNGEAATITAAIHHRLKKDDVKLKQITSFGSDGAS